MKKAGATLSASAGLLSFVLLAATGFFGCGGGGSNSDPSNPLTSVPQVGGKMAQSPSSEADLLSILQSLAPSGGAAPTLGQLAGALPAGTTVGDIPVFGALQGNGGGGVTNLPLQPSVLSGSAPIPVSAALLPGGSSLTSLNSIPVLGVIVVDGNNYIQGLLPIISGQGNPIGVLAIVSALEHLTPSQYLSVINAMAPSGAGLNLSPIIGQLAGAPPPTFTSALPTSTLNSLLAQLLAMV